MDPCKNCLRKNCWIFQLAPWLVVLVGTQLKAQSLDKLVEALDPQVLTREERKSFQEQTWKNLRARGDSVNRRDVATWRTINSKAAWEKVREIHLKRLRDALGGFPGEATSLDVRVTGRIKGDGFTVDNLVYKTRPGFWVTANLYKPVNRQKRMPGILIAHSHHRPKTQGELQDMGMTWARAGCYVLVIDQVGHGERADHPFRSEKDYKKKDSGYRWWRQDYYYRFDTNAQLHLVGQSLMGWMAWDLMRGVDLLLERDAIDPNKIILLGAVAGGGDPAGVTAALDRRIAAAVPFNFGGPQPETRFPLPEDAELRFDYLGGAYWEGTRNLRRTGVDGFFHWLIVGSIAPRRLIYAHEFAWDRERDPVWKRLNKLYGFYGKPDHIDYTLGRGSVRGRAPESTHCTNIGKHHRQRIHQAFQRWFDVNVTSKDEYSKRLDSSQLTSMTDDARRKLQPRKLYEILTDRAKLKITGARQRRSAMTQESRREQVRSDWRALLGQIDPKGPTRVVKREEEELGHAHVERLVLKLADGIIIPVVLLKPSQKPTRVVVAVAQAGKESFLKQRSAQISKLLAGGLAVCLPDLRGLGASRGSRGELGSASYYALMFETPLLGYRLRDLRAVLAYLRTRKDLPNSFAMWGDSFTTPNDADTDFQVPWRVSGRPRFSEPLGGMLALLGALYEDDVRAVYVMRGLSHYQDVLTSPYVFVPHDTIVPGLLTKGDLPDLAAAIAPRPLCLDSLVDGRNRNLSLDRVRNIYLVATEAYKGAANSFRIELDTDAAEWLVK